MKIIIHMLAALLAFVLSVGASVPRFEKNDRVTFIGDSITHGGSYHSNIYLFYATRFPNTPFYMYNCGISGDTTPGTNKRFEQDIAVHKPNRATIMLGMNDAWTWLFDPDEPLESRQAGENNAYKTYLSEMDQLAARLQTLACDITFIKPTIYDQTVALKVKNLVGKNDLLKRYADALDSLTEKYEGTLVDFRTPMMKINTMLQANDPAASLIGPDRVHPKAPGHFVMSYVFLKAQNMPQIVSSIAIDADAGAGVELLNCTLQDTPEISARNIHFTCTENALPFPVAAEQRIALGWVPFQKELNQQVFQVSNLPAGSYGLSIDGERVGTWTAKELSCGINLSDNVSTPQYKQALAVKAVNDARLQVVDKLRAIMHVRHTMLSKLDPSIDLTNLTDVETALKAHLEKEKGHSWFGYLNIQAGKYLEYAPHETDYMIQEKNLMDKMWQVNQPRSHQWVLTPTAD